MVDLFINFEFEECTQEWGFAIGYDRSLPGYLVIFLPNQDGLEHDSAMIMIEGISFPSKRIARKAAQGAIGRWTLRRTYHNICGSGGTSAASGRGGAPAETIPRALSVKE